MKKSLAALAVILGLVSHEAKADQRIYGADLINSTTLAYSTTADLLLDGIDFLSMQAIYSQGAPTAVTFIDGTPSTGQFTVTGSSVGWVGAKIVIGSCRLDEGNQWTAVATATGTAKALSDAIIANACTSDIVTSTWTAAGIVYATSTIVGTSTTYALFSSTPAAITRSAATMTGGSASDISVANDTITEVSHTLTLALPVLFTKTAGTVPTGLTENTTYYAIPTTTSSLFKLSNTSTGAVAGVTVNITATATAGGGTFVLTPLTFAGTPSFKWQYSNDNANWFDVSTDSFTWSSAGNTGWNFGDIIYRYLRLKFTAGTAGGLNLKVTGNGKKRTS
jgi:hypothetical protein